MDWLDGFFGDPSEDERAMLAYLSTAFALSVGLALIRRETPWSGAALSAAGAVRRSSS